MPRKRFNAKIASNENGLVRVPLRMASVQVESYQMWSDRIGFGHGLAWSIS